MPTNVSTPIWSCDLCGATFGDQLDLATLCESAPLPPRLPDGTPVLTTASGRFTLSPLAGTGHVDTDVTNWHRKSGHHHLYRMADRPDVVKVSGKDLAPGLPGYVQDQPTGYSHLHVDGSYDTNTPLDVTEVHRELSLGQPGSAVRLGQPGTRPDDHSGPVVWARPITAPVRAVFDLLGVKLDLRSTRYQDDLAALRYAAGLSGGSLPRARTLVDTTAPQTLTAQMHDLQRRWMAGEDVRAPWPHLEAASHLTASKLTNAHRSVIDATGVPWQPRTNASEYARHLIRELLMEQTPTTRRLFAGPDIVAVGGVKGGVGKSTVAAALSRALAHAGKRVTLIDLDLDGPTQHLLWDDTAIRTTGDRRGIIGSDTDVPGLRVLSHAGMKSLPSRWTPVASADWVRLLGETLDVSETDVIVLDLPAGHGPVADQVIGSQAPAKADVLVAVTTADDLALSGARSALKQRMHERHERILVENASVATGTTPDGTAVQVRLRGREGAVRELADTTGATYAGSLPWAADVAGLAASPQVAHLAEATLAALAAAADSER